MQSKRKERLTDNHVKAALQKDKGTNVQLVSWVMEDFTKKRDNFVGVVKSAEVEYKTGAKENSETYIVKLIPVQPMKALRDMVTQGCRKELLFYQELLPALNAELKGAGLDPLRTPKCLHMNHDPDKSLLIMADLRPRGFKRLRERTCLDVAHTHLVLQELARFHASSLLLETKMGRTNFDVKYNFLHKEWYNVTDDAIAFFKTLFDGNVENTVAILKSLEGDDRAIKWLRKIKSDVYGILEEQMKRDSVFTTLCHADCISTNTLFRYNDNGIPVEVVLLDFQQVRKASLVTDINLLLYICLYGSDRKKNIEGFLQNYFNSFKNVLDANGLQMPFTFQELFEEYRSKVLFGALWGMSVIPMLTGGEKVEEWSHNKDDNEEEEEVSDAEASKEKQKKIDFKIAAKDSELRGRLLPIFEELIERGIIR